MISSHAKGILNFKGLSIVVENPVGSVRSGKDAEGRAWETRFYYPYGYIYGTRGADGEGVDCFIGNDLLSDGVFIISQNDMKGLYDEDKVMLDLS